MAGLFHVLLGDGRGGYRAPVAVKGGDGQPLVVEAHASAPDATTEKICTRPFACDLDGDGALDLVVGNFAGTFVWFRGEGRGAFEGECRYLVDAQGELLRVAYHSDPVMVDWDRDGDLDLVSGSDMGGVVWFPNVGSREEPRFGGKVVLVEQTAGREQGGESGGGGGGGDGGGVRLGVPAMTEPGGALRVCVADVDGDGRMDLLVGDSVQYMVAADGLDESEARRRYAAWKERYDEIVRSQLELQGRAAGDDASRAALAKTASVLEAHYEAQREIVEYRGVGGVWWYRRLR